jgi:hypothetical protein
MRESAERSAETARRSGGASAREAPEVEATRGAHRDHGRNGDDLLLIAYIAIVDVLCVGTVIALVLWGLLS